MRILTLSIILLFTCSAYSQSSVHLKIGQGGMLLNLYEKKDGLYHHPKGYGLFTKVEGAYLKEVNKRIKTGIGIGGHFALVNYGYYGEPNRYKFYFNSFIPFYFKANEKWTFFAQANLYLALNHRAVELFALKPFFLNAELGMERKLNQNWNFFLSTPFQITPFAFNEYGLIGRPGARLIYVNSWVEMFGLYVGVSREF